jgi:hypothetical protein
VRGWFEQGPGIHSHFDIDPADAASARSVAAIRALAQDGLYVLLRSLHAFGAALDDRPLPPLLGPEPGWLDPGAWILRLHRQARDVCGEGRPECILSDASYTRLLEWVAKRMTRCLLVARRAAGADRLQAWVTAAALAHAFRMRAGGGLPTGLLDHVLGVDGIVAGEDILHKELRESLDRGRRGVPFGFWRFAHEQGRAAACGARWLRRLCMEIGTEAMLATPPRVAELEMVVQDAAVTLVWLRMLGGLVRAGTGIWRLMRSAEDVLLDAARAASVVGARYRPAPGFQVRNLEAYDFDALSPGGQDDVELTG